MSDPDDDIPFAPDVNTPERNRIRREMANSAPVEFGGQAQAAPEAPLVQASPAVGGTMHEMITGHWELMSIVTLHPEVGQRAFNAQKMCEVDCASFYQNLALALRWNSYTVICPRCYQNCNYYRAYFKDANESNTRVLVEEMEVRKVDSAGGPKESLTFVCHNRKVRASIPTLVQPAPSRQDQAQPHLIFAQASQPRPSVGQEQTPGYGSAAGHWQPQQQPGPYGGARGRSGPEGY